VENSIETREIAIIDDVTKTHRPEKLSLNQFIRYSRLLKRDIIVTKDKGGNRNFGGSFVKVAIMGDDMPRWVSSTLSEEELKDFVWEHFMIVRGSLYRYY
jgi:pyrimidine operon attenuation protein/uracil phosphoribosyltransferase